MSTETYPWYRRLFLFVLLLMLGLSVVMLTASAVILINVQQQLRDEPVPGIPLRVIPKSEHSLYRSSIDVEAMTDTEYRAYLKDYAQAKKEAGIGHLW